MTMTIVLVALVLAGLAIVISEVYFHRVRTTQSLESLALVVADRATGALAFGDRELAEKNISSLKVRSDITIACIYDKSDGVFAEYIRTSTETRCSELITSTGELNTIESFSAFTNEQIMVVKPIILDNERIGIITIRTDRSGLMAQLAQYLPVLLAIVLIALLVAYLLSRKLQGQVADPIIALDNTARQISAQHDYSIKAHKYHQDEIGSLVDHFNDMISLVGQQQSELVNSKTNLELIVAKRTQELEVSRQQAETANEAKTTFLASMSHELRTPMTAIIGFAELLEMDPGLSASQRDKVNRIGKSGGHLLKLINEILELSKIEVGQVSLAQDTFQMEALVDAIAEIFTPKAVSKDIEFTVEHQLSGTLFVKGDSGKLRQILTNLIENAIKFTPTGSVILQVHSQNEAHQGRVSEFTFEVRDTGVGIGENELDVLFDVFTQTESGKSIGQGTGLGLAIAKNLVELMDGNISVKSQLGEGTCFRFGIPFEVIQTGDAEFVEPRRHGRRIKADQPEVRAMIVDDNSQIRTLLAEILQSMGMEVRTVNNGQEACELFCDWYPQLIWMDLKMPVMDGYQASRLIRKEQGDRTLSIIALTANVMDVDKSMVSDSGCDDLLGKPFGVGEIQETVEKYVNVEFVDI